MNLVKKLITSLYLIKNKTRYLQISILELSRKGFLTG